MFIIKKILSRNIRHFLMDHLYFLPDRLYLQLFYFAACGRFINFKNPIGFNEKQQWLKIYDQHPEYGQLVDKLAVRSHIDKILGPGHLFPLLGQWRNFDEIDFTKLPNEFVLKCNHDSGSTKVITNQSKLSLEEKDELRRHFNKRMNRMKGDFYYAGREYPYKGIERYIIAEQLMHDKENPDKSIEDYKFFCFNGIPKIMFVATDRSTDCRFDFFDMDFNHLDIVNIHPQANKPISKPKHFDEMKKIAEKLSSGMKFVRIDLYELNNTIYFGEYTFFHGGGFALFYPLEWERKLGDWIDLNSPKII